MYTHAAIHLVSGNYDWTSFDVTTDDGYIFKMTRIIGNGTNGASENANKGARGPLILQHGAVIPSEGWYFGGLLTGQKPVPQQLYDEGFDVWLME